MSQRFCTGRVGVAGALVVWLSAATSSSADAPAAPAQGATVLFGERTSQLPSVIVEGSALAIPVDQLAAATGLELKPQGICQGPMCVVLTAALRKKLFFERGGAQWIRLTALAGELEQAVQAVPEARVWSFGEIPAVVSGELESGLAPDFTLADRQGKPVRLAEFRGKKVLLLTWASWCLCSRDLANWQAVYERLRAKDFELVAVAQDTQGEEAAGKYYDLARATFTTLLDPEHTVSSLYHMVNVPTGVWIDEAGRIVRPPEVAYTTSRFLGQEVGGDRYVAALTDWVERGAESPFVLDAAQLAQRLKPRDAKLALADACFRLGVYFQRAGNPGLADHYWQKAQTLSPDNWNYHRQDWAFTPAEAMPNWLRKYRALEGRPYYAPLELPAVEQ